MVSSFPCCSILNRRQPSDDRKSNFSLLATAGICRPDEGQVLHNPRFRFADAKSLSTDQLRVLAEISRNLPAVTSLESALTDFACATPLESALIKNTGGGDNPVENLSIQESRRQTTKPELLSTATPPQLQNLTHTEESNHEH